MKKRILCYITLILGFVVFCSCNDDSDEIKRLVEQYRQSKMQTFIAENDTYGDYEVDVAFIGDSLTDGYNVKEYYPQFTVVNRGIGGDTTFDLEHRLEVSLYDLKPKTVVMLIGANNMETMFDNYEQIVVAIKQNLPHTKVVLLSLTSMSGEWGKKNELAAYNNVKIKLLADKHGCQFVDVYSVLFNLEAGEIFSQYTTDGGHLTAAGYEVITQTVTPVLEALVSSWEM